MSLPATHAIREILGLTRRLEDQLAEERSALVARDSEALLRIAGTKSGLVRALEDGSRTLIWDQLAPEARLELQESLGSCRRHNLANAVLLDARRTQVQWALRFLGVANGNFYGADGAAVTSFAGRAMGSA
jgi:flagellar biosynthesis/type III secretory pathway chaperone